MRKIEEEMLKAIRLEKDWKSDNTEVKYVTHLCYHDNYCEVRLYGNLIAKVYGNMNSMILYDGGHRTVTTKSRLNALFSNSNCHLFQKKHIWYVSLGGTIHTFKNEEFYYMCGKIGELK